MGGGLVISLDFELHWGVRDKRTVDDYRENLLGARAAVPRLLALFERHGIAATWATVGLLFFDDRDAMLAAIPAELPRYADPRLSPYSAMAEVGPDERSDPFHFARSLILEIRAAPRQEIGTHTFSHFYCLAPGQTLAAFRADLAAAVAAAEPLGIRLESIAFPRNQFNAAYLAACEEVGLIAYRGNERSALYAAEASGTESIFKRAGRLADTYLPLSGHHGTALSASGGMVDVPSSRFLRPWSRRLRSLEGTRLARILSGMRHAAGRGQVFHLWFHPHNFGVNQAENLAVMERIAVEAARLRESHGWPSLTMAEAARSARCRAS